MGRELGRRVGIGDRWPAFKGCASAGASAPTAAPEPSGAPQGMADGLMNSPAIRYHAARRISCNPRHIPKFMTPTWQGKMGSGGKS